MMIEQPDRDTMLEMLRRMVTIRVFETTVEGLVDRGEMLGSIHTSSGQEAVCVGAAMAVRADDLMTGHHRSHGHPIAKGADVDALMAELFGKSSGVCLGMGGSMHLADFSIGSLGETAIVASGLPIAVGAALASKMRGWDKVCLAFFGDGASNAGAFHEALNMAAIWKLPVVFLCENNQYGVTTPHRTVSAVEQVADRGVAYNIPSHIVDGQDVLAVWRVVTAAAAAARSGTGPVLVEAMTYRYGEHSYLMSNRGPYRTDEEIDSWRGRDPLMLFSDWLIEEKVATKEEVATVFEGVDKAIAAAVERSRASGYPGLGDLWSGMYVDPTRFESRRHHAAWAKTLKNTAS